VLRRNVQKISEKLREEKDGAAARVLAEFSSK